MSIKLKGKRMMVNLLRGSEGKRTCNIKLINTRYLRTLGGEKQMKFAASEVINISINKTAKENNQSQIDDLVLDIVARNPNLNDKEINKLYLIFDKNKKVFSYKPGVIKDFEASINMSQDNPFMGRPYPVPSHKKRRFKRKLTSY